MLYLLAINFLLEPFEHGVGGGLAAFEDDVADEAVADDDVDTFYRTVLRATNDSVCHASGMPRAAMKDDQQGFLLLHRNVMCSRVR